MIDCVLLPEQCSKVTAPSQLFLFFGSNPKSPCVCLCVCVSLCAICSVEMVDGERRANFYHSCSAATTAPASSLQGKNTHTHIHAGPSTALLPTQSYLPIKLNFSLHLLKMVCSSMSSYLSPSLSMFLSPCRLPRWRLMRAMMR